MNLAPWIFLLIFFSTMGFAQTTSFSTTDFLSTALSHPHLKLHQNTVQYLQQSPHELPILEKLEFRTETNDFEINKQEYTLRFGFSTEKQRIAQRNFHQSNIDYYQVEEQLFLEETLSERYEKLVELYYQGNLMAAQQQKKLVLQDKLMVLQKSIQSTDFDIDELIETEEDLHELEQDLLDLQLKNENLKTHIKKYLPSAPLLEVNANNWLSVEELEKRIQDITADTVFIRPNVQRRQAEINQIQQAYEVEKAEAQNLINYAQLKYSGGNSSVYKHFSVGVGILLPLKNTSLLDLNELELDQLRTKNKLEMEEEENRQKSHRSRAKIDMLLQQHHLLKTQMENNQTAYTLEQYQKIEGVSPLSLLKLKELLLKKEWTILKIEYNLFQTYIEWLAFSGLMIQTPFRDYLSKELSRF